MKTNHFVTLWNAEKIVYISLGVVEKIITLNNDEPCDNLIYQTTVKVNRILYFVKVIFCDRNKMANR